MHNPGNSPTVLARELVAARGDLVFYDSFTGLIPCKIEAVCADRGIRVLRVTATRGAYQRGERIDDPGDRNVIPRDLVYYRSGQARIRSFRWVPPETVGERGVF